MCGIFATTRADLWRGKEAHVLSRLTHRGPDEQKTWFDADSNVLFMQTRLAIIGLGPAGAQPRTDDGSALVYNGEIYNFESLARVLGIQHCVSDTALLHELLRRQGVDAPRQLRGMFAYVYWDKLTRTLTATRDSFGIKPLYEMRHLAGGVTYCSELAPLRLLLSRGEVDSVGLARYLALGHTGPIQTIYPSIMKVTPGCSIVQGIHKSGTAHSRRVLPFRSQASLGTASTLDEVLHDSVSSHVRADVPIGLFLSGGVDSTLLATYAAAIQPGLRAYTISFPDFSIGDEAPLAAANAQRLELQHTIVPATSRELAAAAGPYIRAQGEPFGDPAALPLTLLSLTAARDVKVVLAGEGADELFYGYRRYRVESALGRLPRTGRPGSPRIAAWLFRTRSDDARLRALHAALLGGGYTGHLTLLGSDLASLACVDAEHFGGVLDELRAQWSGLNEGARTSLVESGRRYDERFLLADSYLEKSDRATMVASIEGRVPYLDREVARYAKQTRRPEAGKDELVSLLARRLPNVGFPRRKKGLAVSLPAVLATGLRSYLWHQLADPKSVLASGTSPGARELIGRRAKSSDLTAYRIAMLGLWQVETEAEW